MSASDLIFCWDHSNYLADYRRKWPYADSWLQNDDVVPNSLGLFDYNDNFKFIRLEEQVGAGYNKTVMNLPGLMANVASRCQKSDKLKKCVTDIYGWAIVSAEAVEPSIVYKSESLDHIVDATGWALRSSADTLPLLPLFWADGQDDIDFDFTVAQLLEIVDENGNYIEPLRTLEKIHQTNVFSVVDYSKWNRFDPVIFDKFFFALLFGFAHGYVNILQENCGTALDIDTRSKELTSTTQMASGSVLSTGAANCGPIFEDAKSQTSPTVYRQIFELFDGSPTMYVPDGSIAPNKRAWPVCSSANISGQRATPIWYQMINRNNGTIPRFLITYDKRFWKNFRMPPEETVPTSVDTCISLCEFLTDPRISTGSGHCYIDNVNPCLPVGVANNSTIDKKGEFYSTCNFTQTVADILSNAQFKNVQFDQEGPRPTCTFGSPEYPYNGVYDCVNMWTMMFCEYECVDDFGYPTPCFIKRQDRNPMFSPTVAPVEPTMFPPGLVTSSSSSTTVTPTTVPTTTPTTVSTSTTVRTTTPTTVSTSTTAPTTKPTTVSTSTTARTTTPTTVSTSTTAPTTKPTTVSTSTTAPTTKPTTVSTSTKAPTTKPTTVSTSTTVRTTKPTTVSTSTTVSMTSPNSTEATSSEDDDETTHLDARDIEAMPKSMQTAVSGGASLVTLIIMLYDTEDWLDWFLQLFKSKKLDEEKLAAEGDDEDERDRRQRVNRMEAKVSQIRTATMQMMTSSGEYARRCASPGQHQDILGTLEEGGEADISQELEYEEGSSVSLSRF